MAAFGVQICLLYNACLHTHCMQSHSQMLTCLNCLYRTLLTGSEGLTFPASTEESILPSVTMPRITLREEHGNRTEYV